MDGFTLGELSDLGRLFETISFRGCALFWSSARFIEKVDFLRNDVAGGWKGRVEVIGCLRRSNGLGRISR